MKVTSLKPLNDGIEESAAEQLWTDIEGFAAYSFNRSHTVEYTLISYQSMWLKINFPVEFYAAALTILDEDKLPGLIRDAKQSGITVDMPDINLSSNRFEIATDTRLVIPFQRIKGVSEKTAEAILEARATGRFLDKADFLKRVEKRRCNIRHQEVLDKVGAFAWIEPGQIRPDDPRRVRDQIELVPGLVTANVPVERDMHTDKATKEALAEIVDDYRAKHGPGAKDSDGMPVKPTFGRQARFMVISDAPGSEEDAAGIMGFSVSNTAVQDAMENAGLDRADCYWTALIKRPKRDRQVSPEEIARYAPYLKQELEILAPPIIVLLGSQTVRTFLPDFKGKASDSAGKIIYSKELDSNLVIGFSAGEIWHDPDKQNAMNTVFGAVADLLL